MFDRWKRGLAGLAVVGGVIAGVLASPATVHAASATTTPVAQQVNLTYDGLQRGFLMYRPTQPVAGTVPLIVELGGCCVTAAQEASRAQFQDVAPTAVVVYPEKIGQHWDAGACCGTEATDHLDDVGFVVQVIATARRLDTRIGGVYVAGYSNGGKLAVMLACQRPTGLTAIAVYGATRTVLCPHPPPLSMLEAAGTEDPEISISGTPVVVNGFSTPTVEYVVGQYRAADACPKTPVPLVTAGVTTTHEWSCAYGRKVQLSVYHGLTHVWPEGGGATPSAQLLMWHFFESVGAHG